MAITYKYSDFDIDFNRNEFIDDISIKKDFNSIRQSVMNIVLTKPGEKPFNREFGVGIHNMLFELWTPFQKSLLERNIKWEVDRLEPRAEVTAVNIDEDEIDSNEVSIEIKFNIVLGERSEPIKDSIRIALTKVR